CTGSSICGVGSRTGAPVRAVATLPDGSNETTTIGTAPPDQAASAMRRTLGRPSASAMAPSAEADRITAATVMAIDATRSGAALSRLGGYTQMGTHPTVGAGEPRSD